MSRPWRAPAARSHALRTNLWLIPTIEVAGAVLLFVAVQLVDRAAYHGDITLPAWVDNGSADAARQILTAIAAAVITVVGLVFSITIVALTLASSQFGPRILGKSVPEPGDRADVRRRYDAVLAAARQAEERATDS